MHKQNCAFAPHNYGVADLRWPLPKSTAASVDAFVTFPGETSVGDSFQLSMDVLPSTINHDGILFSIGWRPNFLYFEPMTPAEDTQFLVVEFIYSSVLLLSCLLL